MTTKFSESSLETLVDCVQRKFSACVEVVASLIAYMLISVLLVLVCCVLTISASICPVTVDRTKDVNTMTYKSVFEPTNSIIQINDSSFRSTSLASFTEKLNELFACKEMSKDQRHNNLMSLLENIDFDRNELNQYINFDLNYAYTRNLVTTDGQHYTLLVICWGAGRSSRIHNHPCDGCYVKVMSGSLKETRYTVNKSTNEILPDCENIVTEGMVSFMNDKIGLHKISNPSDSVGAVSLHLYTPPFQKCKVWESSGNTLLASSEAKMCSYSQFGIRNHQVDVSNMMYYI